jgi:hypothetical protein
MIELNILSLGPDGLTAFRFPENAEGDLSSDVCACRTIAANFELPTEFNDERNLS